MNKKNGTLKVMAERSNYMPSDFPLAELTQNQLNSVFDHIPLIKDIYPLSPMQEGLLFQKLYRPYSKAYLVQNLFIIKEAIDLKIFKKSWQMLINHYDVTRTGFKWKNLPKPLQFVQKVVDLNWKDYDFQNMNLEVQKTKLEEILSEDKDLEFDFENPPLIRFYLITMRHDLYYFIFSFHHLLLDGWCASILMNDLKINYTRLIEHRVPKFDQSKSYRVFIEWLQSYDYKKSKNFWKNYLENINVTKLTHAITSASNSHHKNEYATFQYNFSKEESRAFVEFVRAQRTTLSTLFQAAWYMTLRYYLQQDDITFGVVFSGRNVSIDGIEKMVGLFINTLPLRINIDAESSVKDLLNILMNDSITLQKMAHIPLFEVQNCAYIKERDPLFDTILVFENHYVQPVDKNSDILKLELLHTYEPTEYPLTLLISPGEEILLNANYKTENLKEYQIKSVVDHFVNVISNLIKHPQTLLRSIKIITKKEEAMILEDWNNTNVEYPKNTIPQSFDEQVSKTPQRVAVVFNDLELTFFELNNKVNQLAHYLIDKGIKPYQRVAVSLERSPELIISILAILKVGGVYVPIDPDYPVERVKYMLEDSHSLLIIKTKNHEIFKDALDILHLNIEDMALNVYSSSNIIPPLNIVESDIIYTSGSTGKPKGVVQTHRARLNRFQWMWDKYPFLKNEVCCQKTSISFTDAIWEIFGPLLRGVKLVILSDNFYRDPILLINAINKYKITRIVLVPTMLQAIVEAASTKNLIIKPLKLCTVSGEACSTLLAKKFLSINPHTILLNIYGSTESCADATYYEFNHLEVISPNTPIGKPLSNFRTYIVDKYLNLLAPGITGEICISGAGIANGYLNDLDLTKEKFVENPYASTNKHKIMFKTGDIGRYLPDGNIEYLGRLDYQIKIRGCRVDLGEIQTLLMSHPLVKNAIVLMKTIKLTEKYLVAYIVCKKESNKLQLSISKSPVAAPLLEKQDVTFYTTELKNYLGRFLPNYMLPSHFIYIEQIPLTPNGKIDYQALTLSELTIKNVENKYVEPHTSYEKELCMIWSEILGVNKIGIHDDFFMMGGHSLLGIQVVTRIRNTYSIDVPLKYLFDYPTISALGEIIDSLIKHNTYSSLLSSITMTTRKDPIPLSFGQQRIWVLEKMLPNTATYNISRVLRLTGLLNINAFEKAINAIIRRHESLRTVFLLSNKEPCQSILPSFTINLSKFTIDLKNLKKNEKKSSMNNIIKEELNKPFDLALGPLIRAKVIIISKKIHIITFTMHHIIFDGWSMRILMEELSTFYNAYVSKTEPSIIELPIQYADFSTWQRKWLQGEVSNSQLKYWNQVLKGIPQKLALPTDRPRSKSFTSEGSTYIINLNKKIIKEIKQIEKEYKVTLFMILLTVFQLLLSRYSDQEDIVVGTPIANRHYPQVDKIIGFFVNTLVFRSYCKKGKSFKQLLEEVRKQTLEAYNYQDVPFEQLVDYLKISRDLNKNPIFQVMFSVENLENIELSLKDLKIDVISSTSDISKFDLALIVREKKDALELNFEYSKNLFDETTISRMANHYKELLKNAMKNLEAEIEKLPLLTKQEKNQLLIEWNQTDRDYSKDKKLHVVFEEQVKKNPHAIAIVDDNNQISYDMLNKKANQIAHLLVDLGIGKEDVVAVYQDRSWNTIASLYAILKVGSTYVPLDTRWPYTRVLSSLEPLTNLKCVITTSEYANHVQQLCWELPTIKSVFYTDIEDKNLPLEYLDNKKTEFTWDYLSNYATDEITAGGFFSLYTGNPFSKAEVEQYVKHVVDLIYTDVDKNKTVLEIGCGSGLIMNAVSDQVSLYVGVDPSFKTQERNKNNLKSKGKNNIILVDAYAHEFNKFSGEYDIVILASVTQYFPGYNYLDFVIKEVFNYVKPGGKLVIADIIDFRKRETFYQSHIKNSSEQQETIRATGLYVDEKFFNFIGASVKILHEREKFSNELKCRYDVILEKNKDVKNNGLLINQRQELFYTNWHLNSYPKTNIDKQIDSDQIAYIIFTSGSTGIPKGVKIKHRSVINLIEWVNKTFKISKKDKLLFINSFTFDLSVYDVFGILAAGGSLYLVGQNQVKDTSYLADLICNENITFWNSTPMLLEQVTQILTEQQRHSSALGLIFLSGDWIPLSLPNQLKLLFPLAKVVSLGGPTETTVWSNFYFIDRVEDGWNSIPYGKPIQNVHYYILDHCLNPCPIGVTGQLAVSGVCVADGYIGDINENSERFLPNHLVTKDKKKDFDRLYLTGDLGRYFPDGNIELIGRMDNQIKIRGYRIELGEIEHALVSYAGIKQSVVIPKSIYKNRTLEKNKYLVAYYVSEQEINEEKIVSFLQTKLPEYMIPSKLIHLKKLPLSANGKIDRKKLSNLKRSSNLKKSSSIIPSIELELKISKIWSKILGLKKVDVKRNFFELGGNSLLAVKLSDMLSQEFSCKFLPVTLFIYPTIKQLVTYLDKGRQNEAIRI